MAVLIVKILEFRLIRGVTSPRRSKYRERKMDVTRRAPLTFIPFECIYTETCIIKSRVIASVEKMYSGCLCGAARCVNVEKRGMFDSDSFTSRDLLLRRQKASSLLVSPRRRRDWKWLSVHPASSQEQNILCLHLPSSESNFTGGGGFQKFEELRTVAVVLFFILEWFFFSFSFFGIKNRIISEVDKRGVALSEPVCFEPSLWAFRSTFPTVFIHPSFYFLLPPFETDEVSRTGGDEEPPGTIHIY